MPDSALTREDCEALVAGRHADPFAVLGVHTVAKTRRVRSLQPHVRSLALTDRDGRVVAPFKRVHDDGLYEAEMPARLRHYRLLLDFANDHQALREDPYRFASTLGELDRHLLGEGSHFDINRTLGSQCMTQEGISGTRFAVWAPSAKRVSVVADFNGWDGRCHPMRFHRANGLWELFVPEVGPGTFYKYELLDRDGKLLPLKTDPLAHYFEPPPGNASIVYTSNYAWHDADWLRARKADLGLQRPVSIYEVHVGSWRRRAAEGNRSLSWRELAGELIDYVVDLGFTHVELMPVTEHPFDGSWGYQPIGLFAPTQRFGAPDDFRYLVDRCHAAGIGVIVDWVPAHFPRDQHGLGHFDGTALYEHEDPRLGEHADWGTLVFNYGRPEVANYLLGSALHWIDDFHIDGLRVDAVASMLYLDYSRKPGEWLPNRHGGNENLDAVAFLQRFNELVHGRGAITLAEESTTWSGVSRPVYAGGLGFTYKWNMGWMNDTLRYMQEDPFHRSHHHDKLTFGPMYVYDENFVLPLSHDEVVHGKHSLLGRMPGDDFQRFANLRAYFGFMYGHPGKKLLFMGGEFAQQREWNHDSELDWQLLDESPHRGVHRLVRDLNRIYSASSALHRSDTVRDGFEWIDWNDRERSIVSWIRRSPEGEVMICISNFTPVVREGFPVGVPQEGRYRTVLNSDATVYGGSGVHLADALHTRAETMHGQPHSLRLTLPPLATLMFCPQPTQE